MQTRQYGTGSIVKLSFRSISLISTAATNLDVLIGAAGELFDRTSWFKSFLNFYRCSSTLITWSFNVLPQNTIFVLKFIFHYPSTVRRESNVFVSREMISPFLEGSSGAVSFCSAHQSFNVLRAEDCAPSRKTPSEPFRHSLICMSTC